MNTLTGKIKAIKVTGSLSLVHIGVGRVRLSAIVIDTPNTAPYLKIENQVKVIFKATEVILGIGKTKGISLRNKFFGTIQSIESDDILSKIIVDTSVGKITSIITVNAVKELQLQVGSEVTAMIKTNEMMLAE